MAEHQSGTPAFRESALSPVRKRPPKLKRQTKLISDRRSWLSQEENRQGNSRLAMRTNNLRQHKRNLVTGAMLPLVGIITLITNLMDFLGTLTKNHTNHLFVKSLPSIWEDTN